MPRLLALALLLLCPPADAGIFSTSSIVLCSSSDCSSSCSASQEIPSGCTSLGSSLYGSLTCNTGSWTMAVCADSSCSNCISASSGSVAETCQAFSGGPLFSSVSARVRCNELTILSIVLIVLASLVLLCLICCKCGCCPDDCCQEEEEKKVMDGPIRSSTGELQRLLQESKQGAQRAAQQNARLQSKLLAVERELLYTSARVTAMQPKPLREDPRRQRLAARAGSEEEEELLRDRPVPTFIVGYEQPKAGWD